MIPQWLSKSTCTSIHFQGNKVRELKAQKPQNKELIGKEVAVLKELKAALEKAHAQIPKSAPVELPAAKVVNVEPPAESAPFSADKQGWHVRRVILKCRLRQNVREFLVAT